MSEGAYARSTDPHTSSDAATVISVAQAEMAVVELLRKRPARGATSDEASLITGIPRVTISPRFRPLERKGLIMETEERRKGTSGRPSIVWKIIPDRVKLAKVTRSKQPAAA